MNDENRLKEEFELRSKRLEHIYKILYVIAAIWAVLFYSYVSKSDSSAPLYCGLLAVLTTSVINILYFIFSELRCLRITSNIETDTKKLADEKFIIILDTFPTSLFFAMILLWLNILLQARITQINIMICMILGIVTAEVSTIPKSNKILVNIRNMAIVLICYSFFAIFQLNT